MMDIVTKPVEVAVPQSILDAKRIVIKVGTHIVVEDDGSIAYERIDDLCEEIGWLHSQGREIVFVSSGAVAFGRDSLELRGDLSLVEKQACAAVGQSYLMHSYQTRFERYGIAAAQVLLMASDFSERARYLRLREVFEKLLFLRALPIVNENDTVATGELREESQSKSFGDNDKLSALVAGKLEANALLLLTNVDGIFTDNPAENLNAEHISHVKHFDELNSIQMRGCSAYGRGGISSKIEAARVASVCGVPALIANGHRKGVIRSIFKTGSFSGTLIEPRQPIQRKKGWIAFASGYEGIVVVNDGAKEALLRDHKSLLPVGIVGVEGSFERSEVVSIQDLNHNEIGRGVTAYAASEVKRAMGKSMKKTKPPQEDCQNQLPEEVVHRDNLVIFEEEMND